MIRFSRDEDYSLILINSLAQNFQKKLVPLSQVARNYKISLYFLRNLANILVHAGLIKAVEGKKGGYYLLRSPKELTIGQLLHAISPKQPLVCCEKWNEKNHCGRGEDYCKTIQDWRKLNEQYLQKITQLSIEDFMKYHRKQ